MEDRFGKPIKGKWRKGKRKFVSQWQIFGFTQCRNRGKREGTAESRQARRKIIQQAIDGAYSLHFRRLEAVSPLSPLVDKTKGFKALDNDGVQECAIVPEVPPRRTITLHGRAATAIHRPTTKLVLVARGERERRGREGGDK